MNAVSGWKFGLLASLPLFLIAAIIVIFPGPPTSMKIPVHLSLESIHNNASRARISAIYGEDFYGNGAYVDFPQGRTRYWLVGPEIGPRVGRLATAHVLA